MEPKPILTDKIGRIGVITLNRPEARNTFTIPFAEQLDQALRTMDEDPEVLVVVINANGKHFSTGISLDEFHLESQREYRDFEIGIFFFRISRPGGERPLPVVFISDLNGSRGPTPRTSSDRIDLHGPSGGFAGTSPHETPFPRLFDPSITAPRSA